MIGDDYGMNSEGTTNETFFKRTVYQTRVWKRCYYWMPVFIDEQMCIRDRYLEDIHSTMLHAWFGKAHHNNGLINNEDLSGLSGDIPTEDGGN